MDSLKIQWLANFLKVQQKISDFARELDLVKTQKIMHAWRIKESYTQDSLLCMQDYCSGIWLYPYAYGHASLGLFNLLSGPSYMSDQITFIRKH